MNLPDYYAILGVSPKADIETIKRAYRKKVIEFHPDNGGNHRDMVLVNEAWFTLRDSKTRKLYDEACDQTSNTYAQDTAEASASRAKQAAMQYPENASELESWLKEIADDFVLAKYGSEVVGKLTFPTAKGSVSGVAFIFFGGAIGLFLALAILDNFDMVPASSRRGNRSNLFLIVTLCSGGAWLGRHLHVGIASLLRVHASSPESSAASDPEKVILNCPVCNQKLKISKAIKCVTVTCTRCRNDFDI